MWHRDETRPTTYRDITFRSALEAKVAKQLDALGVDWRYELPAHDGIALTQRPHEAKPDPITWYLPDFTILDAPDHLELPLWVEVKPPALLYAVREYLDLPERFEGSHRASLSAIGMRDAQLSEIWKPKRLAEVTDRNVLVVYEINRNRCLSILMAANHIELSRNQPAVNHRQVVHDQERAEQEARWRAEQEQREAARKAEEAEWRQHVVEYARAHGRPAGYDGWCPLCQQQQPAGALVIFRAQGGGWIAVCHTHLDHTAGGTA